MDDFISRRAVIDELNKRQRMLIYCFGFENDMVKIIDIAKKTVIAMPSAQPKREKGHWERLKSNEGGWFYQCSNCKTEPLRDKWTKREMLSDWCPWCGADMRDDDHD